MGQQMAKLGQNGTRFLLLLRRGGGAVMRSRVIKPGFFSDHVLGRLPVGARLLFAGLWCLADRDGRLIDSPRWIAGQVFPHDDDGIVDDVRHWLADLASCGFIHRYDISGAGYIQVVNFSKHQPVHSKESPSVIPPPPAHEDSRTCAVDSVPEIPRLSPGNSPAQSGKIPGHSTSTSTSTSTSGVSVTPNTPLPPNADPPPLKQSEAEQQVEPPPPEQARATESPPTPPTLKQLAGKLSLAKRERARDEELRRARQSLDDFAVAVARRMLLDWMERQAARLPPPDDELCRRLLVAHQMSLDRLRDWLLELRRRGKRPETVQSWGWFAHLAEAEALVENEAAAAAGGVA